MGLRHVPVTSRMKLHDLPMLAEEAGFWAGTHALRAIAGLSAGSLAEFERSLIPARTSEGRARAKANGIGFGRKPKLSTFQIAEAKRLREAGTSLVEEIGRLMGVSKAIRSAPWPTEQDYGEV